MPLPGTYEVVTGRMGRPYLQLGGPRPTNKVLFYGGETNYFDIDAVTAPQLGGVTPIRTHAPTDVGTYVNVGASYAGPDFPKANLILKEKQGAIPKALLQPRSLLNAYLLHGRAKQLSDFDGGWEDYVEIYAGGVIVDNQPGTRFAGEKDDPLMTTLAMVWTGGYYAIGSLGCATKDNTAITLEVLDACYGNRVVQPQYGPANDGTGWIYQVEKGGAAAAPIVHYSVDGGNTWATSSIAVAANAEAPCAIRLMGNFLVVISPTASSATQSGLYYARVNPVTGVPGTWTKVTAGSTNAQKWNDIVVLGPREAYICADAGEILRLIDVTAGPVSLGLQTSNNLTRIHANGDNIVAVGASATVVRSVNRGLTFATTANAPGAATLNAVAVLDSQRIWVGDANGIFYYTLTGGDTAWVTLSLPTTVVAIQDIRFASDEVGYVAYTTTGPLARIATTFNGGLTWTVSDAIQPRLLGVPTSVQVRYNRIAVPITINPGVNCNNLVAVGLGAGTDGVLLQGVANSF